MAMAVWSWPYGHMAVRDVFPENAVNPSLGAEQIRRRLSEIIEKQYNQLNYNIKILLFLPVYYTPDVFAYPLGLQVSRIPTTSFKQKQRSFRHGNHTRLCNHSKMLQGATQAGSKVSLLSGSPSLAGIGVWPVFGGRRAGTGEESG
jgi:hypothetical protein